MSEKQIRDLLVKADKKAVTPPSFFEGHPLEEAADLYTQAANALKLAKKWREAGDAFCKAAEMNIKDNELSEAVNNYFNASKCYRNSNPDLSIKALEQMILYLTKGGHFSRAADNEKLMAEIYETDLKDIRRSRESYERAAEWYAQEDRPATANPCILKAAHFAAELESYPDAIEKFEFVAKASLDSQLTKYSAKECFLKAGLCWLCTQDNAGTQGAIDRYRKMDASFQNTRECQFLVSLLEAVEKNDVDSFTNHVFEYDQLVKLDNWKTALLLRIKQRFTSDETSLI